MQQGVDTHQWAQRMLLTIKEHMRTAPISTLCGSSCHELKPSVAERSIKCNFEARQGSGSSGRAYLVAQSSSFSRNWDTGHAQLSAVQQSALVAACRAERLAVNITTLTFKRIPNVHVVEVSVLPAEIS